MRITLTHTLNPWSHLFRAGTNHEWPNHRPRSRFGGLRWGPFWSLRLRSVKRQLATASKKVDDLKVQLMTSEENRKAQVQTHTDTIMHLEEELASLQKERAVTMNFHWNVTILPLYHVTILPQRHLYHITTCAFTINPIIISNLLPSPVSVFFVCILWLTRLFSRVVTCWCGESKLTTFPLAYPCISKRHPHIPSHPFPFFPLHSSTVQCPVCWTAS
jgi:hypothetical protein